MKRYPRRLNPGAKYLMAMAVLVLLADRGRAFADSYQFEVTPGISVSEGYDDNINLDKENKKSDYITTVSPLLNLNVLSEKNKFQLSYAPAVVRYYQEDQNNTVRHSGSLSVGQDLAEHLRFELTDTYLKTDEPIEETEVVETVRKGRKTYQRNNLQSSLRYGFGAEDALTIGYLESLLKNEDVTIEGGKTQNPFVNLAYWFDVKNGMEARYKYTKADFSGGRATDQTGGETSLAKLDHTGHNAGTSYLHRFTPQTTGSIAYDFTNRYFENGAKDYSVHEGKIGLQQALSADLSYSLGTGYFVRKYEEGADNISGLSYDASLTKAFQKGRFTFAGRKGWGEAYIDVERKGFTQYWSLESKFDYLLAERLSSYVRGSYRTDTDDEGKEWETLMGGLGMKWQVLERVSLFVDYSHSKSTEWTTTRGTCGMKWDFLRWFYLTLDYSRAERSGEGDRSDYAVNRVTLLLGAKKPYKW